MMTAFHTSFLIPVILPVNAVHSEVQQSP